MKHKDDARRASFQTEEQLCAFLEGLGVETLRVTGSADKHEVNAECPFCGDGKPNHFSVNVESSVWNCFKCGESGNLGQLVARLRDHGLVDEAVAKSARRTLDRAADAAKFEGVRRALKKRKVAPKRDAEPTGVLREVVAAAVTLCERALAARTVEAKRARLGLNRRISRATRKRFRLGLVPADLVQQLADEYGFAVADCVEGRVARETSRGVVTRWAGALVIPTVEAGTVLGLDYRLHDPKLIDKYGKYQALGGSPRRLFNADALTESEVIVCEGAFDTMSLVEHGFHAVGVPGNCTFKEEWAERFSDAGVRTALVLLDNGEAGSDKGRERIRERLEAVEVDVVDIYLPDEVKDANDFFIAGGDGPAFSEIIEKWRRPTTRERSRSKRKLAKAGRPQVHLTDRPERDIIRDAWDAALLAEGARPTLFLRGGKLVRLQLGPMGGQLHEVTSPWLRGHLGEVADWGRPTKKDFLHLGVREDIVRVMLARPECRLRVIDRLVRVPVFDREGALISEPGYIEREHAYLALPEGWAMPVVPDRPSEEQMQAAVRLLREELLGDFPFKDDADLAHALAAYLLPFARLLFEGPTPLHLAVAPGPGSGKTLLWELLGIIFLGGPIHAAVLPAGEEEIRKRITSLLLQGTELAFLDNIDAGDRTDRIRSSALAAVTTATMWTDRLLHSSEMVTVPNIATWLLTGNNVDLSVELARRTVQVRITPEEDEPWSRTGFKHEDIKAWTTANRTALVHALLMLIQAWLGAGKPKFSGPSLGSFVAWRNTIGGILQNAGIDGFLGNLDETMEESDAESATMEHFVVVWAASLGEAECSIEELHKLCLDKDLLADLLDGKGGHGQRTALGRELARHRHRSYGGFTILPVRDSGHKGRTYRLNSKEPRDDE